GGQNALDELADFFGNEAGFDFSLCSLSKAPERAVIGSIGKLLRYNFLGLPPDWCSHGARFDQDDLDPEEHQFASQTIRISLQTELGSGISTGKWHRQSPADRAYVNDSPRFANAVRFGSEQW